MVLLIVSYVLHFITPRRLTHGCQCMSADAVPADTPRLLINMNRVGEKKQNSQQTQQPATQRRTHASSSNGSDSSDSSDSEDDTGSISGYESDATALTASSSCINLAAKLDGSSGCDGANVSKQAQQSGFDFDAGFRDVAHLGTCDVGVMQLAELLGWGGDLHELIRQGAEEFEAARQDWDD